MAEVIVGSIIGFVAALVGAWFGAHLAAKQSEKLETSRRVDAERIHRAQIMAAARLVFIDLGAAAVAAEGAVSGRYFLPLRSLPTTAWANHGVSLASELADEDYDTVAEACSKVGSVVAIAHTMTPAAASTAIKEGVPPEIQKLEAMCRAAREALHPLAYPSAGPAAPA